MIRYGGMSSGWVSIVLGLILLAIFVFAFWSMSRTMNELKIELNNLRNILEETRKNTEEVKRKLEEV